MDPEKKIAKLERANAKLLARIERLECDFAQATAENRDLRFDLRQAYEAMERLRGGHEQDGVSG